MVIGRISQRLSLSGIFSGSVDTAVKKRSGGHFSIQSPKEKNVGPAGKEDRGPAGQVFLIIEDNRKDNLKPSDTDE